MGGGGGVSSRGLFPRDPSKTGELSKTNSRSVEQTLSYFTVDDLLVTFLLAKQAPPRMEIPGGWGSKGKVPSVGGDMYIFWNYMVQRVCF